MNENYEIKIKKLVSNGLIKKNNWFKLDVEINDKFNKILKFINSNQFNEQDIFFNKMLGISKYNEEYFYDIFEVNKEIETILNEFKLHKEDGFQKLKMLIKEINCELNIKNKLENELDSVFKKNIKLQEINDKIKGILNIEESNNKKLFNEYINPEFNIKNDNKLVSIESKIIFKKQLLFIYCAVSIERFLKFLLTYVWGIKVEKFFGVKTILKEISNKKNLKINAKLESNIILISHICNIFKHNTTDNIWKKLQEKCPCENYEHILYPIPDIYLTKNVFNELYNNVYSKLNIDYLKKIYCLIKNWETFNESFFNPLGLTGFE